MMALSIMTFSITVQSRATLNFTTFNIEIRKCDTQENDTHYNDIQQNDTHYNDIQQNDTHLNENDLNLNDIQNYDNQHNNIQHYNECQQ
jgi:hypothetical protein